MSISLCVYKSVCLCVHMSLCPNVYVPICPCPTYLMSMCQYVHMYVSMCPCVCVSMYPCFHMSIYVYLCPSVFMSMSPYVLVSIYPYVRVTICNVCPCVQWLGYQTNSFGDFLFSRFERKIITLKQSHLPALGREGKHDIFIVLFSSTFFQPKLYYLPLSINTIREGRQLQQFHLILPSPPLVSLMSVCSGSCC